uniref:Uncharacterized protein n=1 Tax=Chrysotila carterae TaxID=13221 RepID=A0A7S4F1G7_CHRCT|mmetsp:Transcript_25364/g.55449  ORF Transcript_25364/g.55449 Transcript_25364/m.55449 type:complete len:105 (-) Transcript_25364:966-1280(-)
MCVRVPTSGVATYQFPCSEAASGQISKAAAVSGRSCRSTQSHDAIGSNREKTVRLLDERVKEHTADADGTAEQLDGLQALAESNGDADDNDDALGGVGDRLRRR